MFCRCGAVHQPSLKTVTDQPLALLFISDCLRLKLFRHAAVQLPMTNYILTAALLLFICCGSDESSSQKISDLNLQSAGLSVRNAHAMAYSDHDDMIYLFGGADEKQVLGDLWRLHGNAWEKVQTAIEPPARTFPGMTFDIRRERLVLFGGNRVLFGDGTESHPLLNDTWFFKNGQWQRTSPKTSPGPRAEASMAYDQEREVIVLFGGYRIENGNYVKLADTWEFSGNNWALIADEGPTARHGAGLVYHEKLGAIMLFGGSTVDRQYGESSGETWLWDGKDWQKQDIDQPAGIFNPAMTYDPDRNETICFGGWNGEKRINQTSLFVDDAWHQLLRDISPSPRNHSALVYDKKEKRAILFGGHSGQFIFGDTWEFRDHQWYKISEVDSLKRLPNRH